MGVGHRGGVYINGVKLPPKEVTPGLFTRRRWIPCDTTTFGELHDVAVRDSPLVSFIVKS